MAKKSMIEREKKRIRLENKYSMKRATLLQDYKQEHNFAKKLEIYYQPGCKFCDKKRN